MLDLKMRWMAWSLSVVSLAIAMVMAGVSNSAALSIVGVDSESWSNTYQNGLVNAANCDPASCQPSLEIACLDGGQSALVRVFGLQTRVPLPQASSEIEIDVEGAVYRRNATVLFEPQIGYYPQFEIASFDAIMEALATGTSVRVSFSEREIWVSLNDAWSALSVFVRDCGWQESQPLIAQALAPSTVQNQLIGDAAADYLAGFGWTYDPLPEPRLLLTHATTAELAWMSICLPETKRIKSFVRMQSDRIGSGQPPELTYRVDQENPVTYALGEEPVPYLNSGLTPVLYTNSRHSLFFLLSKGLNVNLNMDGRTSLDFSLRGSANAIRAFLDACHSRETS